MIITHSISSLFSLGSYLTLRVVCISYCLPLQPCLSKTELNRPSFGKVVPKEGLSALVGELACEAFFWAGDKYSITWRNDNGNDSK